MSYRKMATVQEKEMCVLWFFETKSIIKIQLRYRTQYGKYPASYNVIRHCLKKFQETDSVVAAVDTATPQMLENIWREIEYRLDILRAMKIWHVEVV
jgi:hypothetical protein